MPVVTDGCFETTDSQEVSIEACIPSANSPLASKSISRLVGSTFLTPLLHSIVAPIPPANSQAPPLHPPPLHQRKGAGGHRCSQVDILPLHEQIQQNTLTVQLTSLSTLLHTTSFFFRMSKEM